MKNKCRKLGIILFFSFFLFSGCVSEKLVYAELPDFTPYKPSKPFLSVINDGIGLPSVVLENTIKLQNYALELEVYAEGWEKFYSELRKKYAQNK